MDAIQREHELRIERYVLNKMCDEEATEFEIEYLTDQACIEQLEMAERLYQGLNTVAAEGFSTNSPATIKPLWWQKNVPVWSIAATIIMMILPFSLINDLNTATSVSNTQLSVVSIEMAELRGVKENTRQISHSNQQLIISTYIDSERIDLIYPSYSFKLKDQRNNTPIVSLTNVHVNQDNMLYFNLGQNVVKTGHYHYSITGQTEKGKSITLKEGDLTINNQP